MRIALFGGTFDPPHRGHLAIAAAAADAFALDRVLFAPVGRQPLKAKHRASPFPERLAMAALACAADPRFELSTIDTPREDGAPNYTVDALATLRIAFPHDRLFNLVGADSFLHMRQWREPDRLLELAEWIVVSRPGFSFNRREGPGGPEGSGSFDHMGLTPVQRARIHMLAGVEEDIAATNLRERLEAGADCISLLPQAVCEYIASHRLYHQSS